MTERVVKLTDKQFEILWDDSQVDEAAAQLLAKTLEKFSHDATTRRRQYWESARRIANAPATSRLKIDFANREITVIEGDDETTD